MAGGAGRVRIPTTRVFVSITSVPVGLGLGLLSMVWSITFLTYDFEVICSLRDGVSWAGCTRSWSTCCELNRMAFGARSAANKLPGGSCCLSAQKVVLLTQNISFIIYW